MNETEQSEQVQSPLTGVFATLAAIHCRHGGGAPAGRSSARARRLRAPVAFLLVAALLGLSAASASAEDRISPGAAGVGAGQFDFPGGLAVSSKEGGDIYVANGGTNRIDQFDPSRAPGERFVRGFGWGVLNGASELQTCTTATGCQGGLSGSGPGQLSSSDEIAIDNDGESASYGDVYVVDQPNYRVEKFAPNGEFLLMFGGEVDQGPHHPGNLCTAEYVAEGDTCGTGVPGPGPAHFYHSGSLDWAKEGSNSIALGPNGTVYVGDYGRIQEFNSDGSFAGEFELPVAPGEEPQFVTALGLAPAGSLNEGDIFERSAVYGSLEKPPLTEVPGIREYSPTHTLLRTVAAEESSGDPAHLALGRHGELFVAELKGEVEPAEVGREVGFRAFKPDGSLYAIFGAEQSIGFGRYPSAVAVGDGAGRLYAPFLAFPPSEQEFYVANVPLPVEGPPSVTAQHLTDLETTTATLNAVLNPEQFGTTSQFQYITRKRYEEDGDSFGAGTVKTPEPPENLGSVSRDIPVQGAISGLTPATAYRWRVLAENECNGPLPAEPCRTAPEAEFETLPPVSVRDLTTQTVGPELVQFKVELSPNNGSGSEYEICIGEEEGAYTRCSPGPIHALGNEFEKVITTFTGLQPDTIYHYQLTAHNSNGPYETADAEFTTELSSAEERAVESCPNTGLREEDASLALPDCRSWEQVTPTDKHGGEADGSALAPGGERFVYGSLGSFAGAASNQLLVEYVAHRTPGGWLSQAVLGRPAPFGTEPATTEFGGNTYMTPELDRWLFGEYPGLNVEAAIGKVATAYFSMGFADGSFLLHATPTFNLLEGEAREVPVFLQPAGASEDLSRLFLFSFSRLLPGLADPRADDYALDQGISGGSNGSRIYEAAGVGGPDPTLSLVDEVPLGLSVVSPGQGEVCTIDSAVTVPHPSVRLISSDGTTVFYTRPIEGPSGSGHGCGPGTPNPFGLFARPLGAAPIQLNAPPPSQCSAPSPCAGAAPATPSYYGSSPDGTRAWFTTAQPLIDSDADATADLYLAKLENGHLAELVQASAGDATDPHPGKGAGVAGALGISPDGSHAAFVATGVLTTEENGLHQSAAAGADNLYVYDSDSAQTKFLTRLCSAPERSGSLADPACPADLDSAQGATSHNDAPLWLSHGSPSRFTPDGRYLLFTSFGRLSADDTDQAADVYRYDFVSGQLVRLSFGHDGNDGNGNDDSYPAELTLPQLSSNPLVSGEDASRSISADGSIVIFQTAAPLVSHDTNAGANPGCGQGTTGCDIYEWEEQGRGTCLEAGGCVSLLSSGLAPQGAQNGVISASGRDVTFLTRRGLIPADSDGVADAYDARENGGFPAPRPDPCHEFNAHCPGSESPQPKPPIIGTETFVGNETTHLECGKGRHRVKKHGQVRCVPNKPHKKHHQKKHKRAARANRGGAK